MEYIIILIIHLLILLIMKYAFNIKISDIKKIKKIGYDKELNKITDKLEKNEQVCRGILKKLENENVLVKINDDEIHELTYYNVVNNNIVISNINETFTRIQTIAHECLHSIQNRRMLMFNFIFSNIYMITFFLISLLTILRVIKEPLLFLIGFILLGIIYYFIRSYLETDAMTKAPYLAKEYIESTNILSEQEIQTVMKNYETLNYIGIPFTNYRINCISNYKKYSFLCDCSSYDKHILGIRI